MSWLEQLDKLDKEQQKNFIEKHREDKIKEIKLSIIAQAYNPILTANDLMELASILSTISNMKPVKKKGL